MFLSKEVNFEQELGFCPFYIHVAVRNGNNEYVPSFFKVSIQIFNETLLADEETAIAAEYRPCAKCMTKEYADWKAK